MKPFENFTGLIGVLDRANVDTDQIIPKQFLKSIQRTGFGKDLFYDWRYLTDGKPNPDFPLNQNRFRGSSILVVRNNFGCGSSREHAVWAIQQDGYRAVVAPRVERQGNVVPAFADIFKNNCSKNGLLTIELSEHEVDRIFDLVNQTPGLRASIDLKQQTLVLETSPKVTFKFEIDSAVKERFIHGHDDIGMTLTYESQIKEFETKHHTQRYGT
ncbi:MAG: 3-isopropylmalate dehydratase small subunit [Candidatus Omnitrophica bacterium CG11_big_fil_rev_8_21_14_0_20_45_26]|uniref:3-isopropylmalate dehydratase small subunit n=1 Tax=Candidatus Abzuiibacterium crystallinum TaxID=1974748 RepID=A0A2H0LPS3_9BACT|nr:MAG: 3-isopropylmalate dehydratase small subunit [Candidatus Omnitrophica bacterium CG11_big_fil_rev_8_21_14_0_20_45_26]PIW65200.1 MAG: 3-isopropylmalate dehydratase small subunit [Candidatus Omnitrophica bacterium CG12_big_fil_rev_8_21_14_0_65_45_16]